jgi:aspartate dehydrogenase
MARISLIGCGNIATIIAEKGTSIDIVDVFDLDFERAREYARSVGARACESFEEFLATDAPLIVEAASPKAVEQHALDVVRADKALMIMSVGGLADTKLRKALLDEAADHGTHVYIPSGAIGGLDAISSARVGGLDEVVLETRKPPRSLDVDVNEETTVFEGTPAEAIERFPRNINVAVTLAVMAGDEKVRVRIMADPNVSHNIHTIKIRGETGTITMEFNNAPSPNMATSLIAGYSAVALIERIFATLQF